MRQLQTNNQTNHRRRLSRTPNRTAGFTIIEVLIVLAIAGVIMLIVFLAIPQLERNSRNNQRRQDISTVLRAVSQYELNNSADFPPNVSALTMPALTFYDPTTDVSLHDQSPPPPATDQGPVNTDTMEVWNYLKCDPNSTGHAITQGSDYSDIVALYGVESGSGTFTGQCQQL